MKSRDRVKGYKEGTKDWEAAYNMLLDDGITCNDCRYVKRCCYLFGQEPYINDGKCQFYPNRFSVNEYLMKYEINEGWYCVSGIVKDCPDRIESYAGNCTEAHRKWPTPEQFKEEYGKDYPDDGAVFVEYNGWTLTSYLTAKEDGFELVVCACTPWGKPHDDWRPK